MRGVCAALALHACLLVARATDVSDKLNPITRVVQLMQNMAKKVETDGKKEAELFETYQCWYKTVVSTKTASNKLAKDRIESLESYISDIEAGKIEFTGEREALEKEVDELQTQIDTSKADRATENENFVAASEEMENAIAALEKAVEVLGDATKGGAFLQTALRAPAFLSLNGDLRRALSLGQGFVPKTHAALLRRVLDGASTTAPDDKYKAKSSKIQEILADMLQTFQDNLEDAKKMEKQKKESYDNMMTAWESQLESASSALSSGNEEGNTRELNKQEALKEKSELQGQFDRDKKFLEQVQESYDLKNEEFQERNRLRAGEIAAITEAASVLSSDEARDISKKSMDSQGYLLLQAVDKVKCLTKRAEKARTVLRKLGVAKHDMRVVMLSMQLRGKQLLSKGHFEKVEKSIDEMCDDLAKENDQDLETKEKCEADRMENTNIAKKTSRQIDDTSAHITRKNAEAAELKKKIAEKEKQVEALKVQIKNAAEHRDIERADFEANKADDDAAKGLVEKSMVVLKKFYEDEGLALAQVGSHRRASPYMDLVQEQQDPGEAPPPPPPTWSEPYGGAKGESNGIAAIMDMILEDIQKDIDEATALDDASKKDFEDFKSDTEGVIGELEEGIGTLGEELGEVEEGISTAKDKRDQKKGQLDNTMQFLRSIAPECDFINVNFQTRKEERAKEIDGLMEAKAALAGGSFEDQKAAVAEDAAARSVPASFLQRRGLGSAEEEC